MARRYTRDNRGRFASVGATARGGRLKTAGGNKRKTVKATAAKRATPSGAIRKTDVITARVQNGISKNIERRNKAGLNPSTAAKENQTTRLARAQRRVASNRRAVAKSVSRPDTAMANIPMAGSRGRRLDSEISRNVKAQKSQARAEDKARNRQFKSDQSRAKRLRDAHVGGIAKAKGISKAQVESALKAQPASVQIKAIKNWVKQNREAAKPAAQPKSAQELVNASVRKVQNKKLHSLNNQIKAAGPNAGGLRLEKLALQTRMTSTRPKPSAKQQAKQQASTNALRARMSRMKRAQARIDATADTRNIPGSKMIRRPDAKTSRSNRRAEQARSIYLGASGTSIKNFAKGVARTARAKNNWRPVRSSRPR